MKKNTTTFLCCLLMVLIYSNPSNAQLVINGGSLTLGAGASITVQGDLSTNADILGTGKIIMNGSSPQQLNMNGFTVPNLEINSSGGITLASSAKVGNTLNFVAGTFSTNPATAFELIASVEATFTFAVGTEIIGKVRREGWVNGSSIAFNGTNMVVNTSGGTAPTSMLVNMVPNGDPTGAEREVKRFFDFTPTGGSGYTATVTFPYKASEINTNTEDNLAPWYMAGFEWNGKLTGNSVNTGADFVTTTGIDATTFAASEWKLADPVYSFNVTALLRGAFSGSTMNTALNTAGFIPLAQPYNTAPYNTLFGYSGTESVTSIPNANIVDWVLLELRKPSSGLPADAASSTIIGRKAAFLLNNGTVVNLDGVTPASFEINKQGASFIVVRHRNHLGVMSNSIPSNAAGTFANDFTTTLTGSYKNPGESSEPLVALAGGKLGLWAGNVNTNTDINAGDVSAVKLAISNSASGYQIFDVNLNGDTNAGDASLVKTTIGASGKGSVTARSGEGQVVSSLPK